MGDNTGKNWVEDWKVQFIDRVATDKRSLNSVCKDEDMPGYTFVYEEFTADKEFADNYMRAKDKRADAIFEEILEIADDASNDYMMKLNADGEEGYEVLNSEHVQRSKLRIDSRKWMLGKMQPKKYGDKLDLGISGSMDVTISTEDSKL